MQIYTHVTAVLRIYDRNDEYRNIYPIVDPVVNLNLLFELIV